MNIKAYHVFTDGKHTDNWGVLAFAESANQARSLVTGFYDCLRGDDRNEEYYTLRAKRLPHMDNHWHQGPAAMDGTENMEARRLVDLSKIHECPACGSTECDWTCDE